MDPGIFEHYNRELALLRELGGEFARANPAIASRLKLDERECADPYVERLIEAVAFLAARTQLKLEARHPLFTQQLLAAVNPTALCPFPSAVVLELVPRKDEDALRSGVAIPAGTELRSEPDRVSPTACEFRTTQSIALWPLSMVSAKYLPGTASLESAGIEPVAATRAVLELRLQAPAGMPLSALPVDTLDFHVAAAPDTAARICDQLLGDCCGLLVQGAAVGSRAVPLAASALVATGLEDETALLPPVSGGVDSFRLLREYAYFPQKFRFFRITGLRSAFLAAAASTTDSAADLIISILLRREDSQLTRVIQTRDLRLHCVPAINAFRRRVDRVDVAVSSTSFEVIADRSRRLAYEIYSVETVAAIDASGRRRDEIAPLYAAGHGRVDGLEQPYYTLERRLRTTSAAGAAGAGTRTDMFISLLDARGRVAGREICQLEIDALCTNADLPHRLAVGSSQRPLAFVADVPVDALRVLVGPTAVRATNAIGDAAWRSVSFLSTQALPLAAADPVDGARRLRELLSIYVAPDDRVLQRQLEGMRKFGAREQTRRIPGGGPIAYGRGIAFTLEVEEGAFAGVGALTFGAVLEQFLARYATLNTWTSLDMVSTSGRVLHEFPARLGRTRLL